MWYSHASDNSEMFSPRWQQEAEWDNYRQFRGRFYNQGVFQPAALNQREENRQQDSGEEGLNPVWRIWNADRGKLIWTGKSWNAQGGGGILS